MRKKNGRIVWTEKGNGWDASLKLYRQGYLLEGEFNVSESPEALEGDSGVFAFSEWLHAEDINAAINEAQRELRAAEMDIWKKV